MISADYATYEKYVNDFKPIDNKSNEKLTIKKYLGQNVCLNYYYLFFQQGLIPEKFISKNIIKNYQIVEKTSLAVRMLNLHVC
jgi:hypothetical protein